MEPAEVEVSGHRYKIGRLNLMQSLELTRHVAPILPAVFGEVLGGVLQKVKENGEGNDAAVIAAIAAVSEPILTRVSMIPEGEFQRIVTIALGACERQVDRSWARVTTKDGVVMFDDISGADAIVLVWNVMVREIKPFISALSSFA